VLHVVEDTELQDNVPAAERLEIGLHDVADDRLHHGCGATPCPLPSSGETVLR
jgi:hypothetical protein